ncbi:MAG: class I SAM-dependent methyltransferase [Phycisphaeraceae bacterium]|nr:class I SAM-dependent methyltransferase [Phycisphaeraceae bacterium]
MIDDDKVHQIVASSQHGYYERERCRFEREGMLGPRIDDIFRRVCDRKSQVLDIGCGNGRTLLRNALVFGQGVGLDNDPIHLRLAEANKAESGVGNVEFVEGRNDNLPFEAKRFDFVFSERGPLAGVDVNTCNALRVLRRGGVILVETPGVLLYFEPGYIFDWQTVPLHKMAPTARLDDLAAVLARNGVDVQIASSHIERLVFADFYEWLKFHLSTWDYYPNWRIESWPPTEHLRHGIDRFLRMVADDQGRIHVTNHRLWVGGVKR